MAGRSAKDLNAEYRDPQWQGKFAVYCDLVEILADCIIANDYTIPDDLNEAIPLSAAGIAVKDKLIRKSGVPAKEAQLMCALTVGHADLFVDIDSVDLERFESSVHRQIVEGELRFPFTYGHEFYDAYASTFEDEKDVLTLDETIRLIDRVPKGVFQYGAFVVGPFGLCKSLSARSIRFTRRVPAYHCAQPVCHEVHPVRLSTGHDAAINAQRDKLHRLLDDGRIEPADWFGFAHEITGYTESFYGDHRVGTHAALIGDCLGDEELRTLASYLLDNTKGELRKLVGAFLPVQAADDAVRTLSRAELLQVVLLAKEESISRSIDRLVRDGSIVVPRGEVRRPVVNSRSMAGAFRLTAELGHHGVRFVSDDQGVALLRERRLLRKLYVRDNATDTEELDWQLRGFAAEDLDERLEDFFRSTDPRAALKRMILARKTNMITACDDVGLEDGEFLSDEDLVETVLWKLGFDVHFEEDPHLYFWDLQQRISALTQSSRISGIGESEIFRGVASSYFAELEGLLIDSLAFGSWALLTDHTSARFPFSYDNESDRTEGLRRLQAAHVDSDNEIEQFDFESNKVELFALIRGFGILADELARVETEVDVLKRPADDFPDYDQKTELKSFLFRSTVPHLDLTAASRTRIVQGLRRIAGGMQEVEVNQVRNDYSHYRRTSPEIERMAKALEAIGAAVREIENLGVSRLLCWPTGVSSDAWGRTRHEFSGPRSIEHMFARPSSFDWMGLPSLREPQFLLRAAIFAEPNEVLRFTRRFESDFSRLWQGYPSRRKANPDAQSVNDDIPTHPDDLEMSR